MNFQSADTLVFRPTSDELRKDVHFSVPGKTSPLDFLVEAAETQTIGGRWVTTVSDGREKITVVPGPSGVSVRLHKGNGRLPPIDLSKPFAKKCRNRECNNLGGQPGKPRSIYCSKRCQSREQNLRQGRIKNVRSPTGNGSNASPQNTTNHTKSRSKSDSASDESDEEESSPSMDVDVPNSPNSHGTESPVPPFNPGEESGELGNLNLSTSPITIMNHYPSSMGPPVSITPSPLSMVLPRIGMTPSPVPMSPSPILGNRFSPVPLSSVPTPSQSGLAKPAPIHTPFASQAIPSQPNKERNVSLQSSAFTPPQTSGFTPPQSSSFTPPQGKIPNGSLEEKKEGMDSFTLAPMRTT